MLNMKLLTKEARQRRNTATPIRRAIETGKKVGGAFLVCSI